MTRTRRQALTLLALGGAGMLRPPSARAGETGGSLPESRLKALVASYPDHLAGIEGDALVWRDGARMPIRNDAPARAFAQMLRDPTLADQLRQPYPRGPEAGAPEVDSSPGRLRHLPFFLKMYGDCRAGPIREPKTLVWMPKSGPQRLTVTGVNDVAGRLTRMQDALEGMPDRVRAFLIPSAGTLVCRPVADTGLLSMHAFGAAIDLNVGKSDYWAWHKSYRPSRAPKMPAEIVALFEENGFIWGGKWWHYDTMHFEYRPELLDG